jgi:hypothetical protein
MAVKRRTVRKSFNQRMQELAHEYMKLHNVDSIELEQVSEWCKRRCKTRPYDAARGA